MEWLDSVDPDQTAPSGSVWSGSTLFSQTCLFLNFQIITVFEGYFNVFIELFFRFSFPGYSNDVCTVCWV